MRRASAACVIVLGSLVLGCSGGATPERTLMIGDTTHDLQLAVNAGTPCVAVSYGAHDHEALAGFEPLFVAHSTHELHDWLARHG